jgi:hypothetical protein
MGDALHQDTRQPKGAGAESGFSRSDFLRGRAILTGVKVLHNLGLSADYGHSLEQVFAAHKWCYFHRNFATFLLRSACFLL